MTTSPGSTAAEYEPSAGERAILDALAATGTASAEDGAISVTVDARGQLVAVSLSRRAFEQRPETVGATIVELSRQARNDAEVAMSEELAASGRVAPRPMSQQRFQDALAELDRFDFGVRP